MVQEIEGGSVVFGDDETTVPSRRRNLFEATEQVMRSVAFSYAQKTVQELEQLFDGTSPVANPKDPRDLKRLVEYLCGPNDTVLELFSRSGEMAHAVLEANVESGSSRRFICVHLPEVLDPTHPAGRAALALCQALEVNPTTASVARDRLTRVCVKQGRGEVGYRAFRLAESCFKTWDPSFEEVQAALFDAVENKKADRSDEDVVWEILLKYGLDIGIRVEHRRLHEGTAFVIGGAVLVVYLGQVHSAKTVRDIVAIKNELEPLFMRVVFDDAGFLDDIIKTNASQALAQAGVTDVRSV
jgi:adenine-specific DNA-methyltransferase